MRFAVWCVAALLMVFHAGASASSLAEKLLTSQYVLLMRHALAPGVGDPQGYSLDRCETQRNLDEQGKQQAVRAGQWLRKQGIQSATVLSSVWCRCQQTADRLAYGPVTIEPSLASFFDTPGVMLCKGNKCTYVGHVSTGGRETEQERCLLRLT